MTEKPAIKRFEYVEVHETNNKEINGKTGINLGACYGNELDLYAIYVEELGEVSLLAAQFLLPKGIYTTEDEFYGGQKIVVSNEGKIIK